MHELVNRLVKSVVRLTDRHELNIVVDCDVKLQTKKTTNTKRCSLDNMSVQRSTSRNANN